MTSKLTSTEPIGVLTTEEVAALLKRKPATVTRWVRMRLLAPIKGTGGSGGYLFAQDEVRRFVQAKEPISIY